VVLLCTFWLIRLIFCMFRSCSVYQMQFSLFISGGTILLLQLLLHVMLCFCILQSGKQIENACIFFPFLLVFILCQWNVCLYYDELMMMMMITRICWLLILLNIIVEASEKQRGMNMNLHG